MPAMVLAAGMVEKPAVQAAAAADPAAQSGGGNGSSSGHYRSGSGGGKWKSRLTLSHKNKTATASDAVTASTDATTVATTVAPADELGGGLAHHPPSPSPGRAQAPPRPRSADDNPSGAAAQQQQQQQQNVSSSGRKKSGSALRSRFKNLIPSSSMSSSAVHRRSASGTSASSAGGGAAAAAAAAAATTAGGGEQHRRTASGPTPVAQGSAGGGAGAAAAGAAAAAGGDGMSSRTSSDATPTQQQPGSQQSTPKRRGPFGSLRKSSKDKDAAAAAAAPAPVPAQQPESAREASSVAQQQPRPKAQQQQEMAGPSPAAAAAAATAAATMATAAAAATMAKHRSSSPVVQPTPSNLSATSTNSTYDPNNLDNHHSRDGFCRRVDSYDGQIIVVDGRPTYEVGNYLGGGVAGVVYEGTRLLPIEEYPVRMGVGDIADGGGGGGPGAIHANSGGIGAAEAVTRTGTGRSWSNVMGLGHGISTMMTADSARGGGTFEVDNEVVDGGGSMICSGVPFCGGEESMLGHGDDGGAVRTGSGLGSGAMAVGGTRVPSVGGVRSRGGSTVRSSSAGLGGGGGEDGNAANNSSLYANTPTKGTGGGGATAALGDNVAIEIPRSPTDCSNAGEMIPVMDAIDAPSRSRHYTRAASRHNDATAAGLGGAGASGLGFDDDDADEHAVIVGGGGGMGGGKALFMEETVAVKILNPVGFRLLPADSTAGAVVVKEGEPLDPATASGARPMKEKHVWWLVNPNSRNLRTLQKQGPAGDAVDRGSADRGLRLSLVAAYVDPRTGTLRELPLTRCIEIWGHAPFGASEAEFDAMMDAIERVNAGHPPSKYASPPPSRVGTEESAASGVGATSSGSDGYLTPVQVRKSMFRKSASSTGLARAMAATRVTVYCGALNAYIAVPAVPPKYLRWLRQRRAATKEIRHMMQIGRHQNVVHLYEVLELIQDSKSTMFLILELVRGGELFDLISSSSAKSKRGSKGSGDPADDPEVRMRKFFQELASGIAYCHANGIAHRDLKPENLLVHNGTDGQTLKIADFGLSATFHMNQNRLSSELDFMSDVGSLSSPMSSVGMGSPWNEERDGRRPSSPMASLKALGQTAMSYLTCGSVDNVVNCFPGDVEEAGVSPEPLRRMTSIVGSPHYVAPEIISQSEHEHGAKKNKSDPRAVAAVRGPNEGYDGTKADVWSAGVILYAMLFRSLPFGEDLLRCPRYQSFSKWYDEARRKGGRRSSAAAALSPKFTEGEEEEMLGPHWFFPAETSRESRDLIVAMLNPDAFERLSIDMVLRHPWLTSYKPGLEA